ncbi:hypothetical protein OIU78_012918 [Salix suchowensis]|nr:hypothetical protein OIU78_012918 [Salix suchowensis]
MNSLYARNSVVEDTIGESVLHIPEGRIVIFGARESSKYYYGCSNASIKFANVDAVTQPNRYLLIVTSGGLNQQRTGITDAVVAARILNATLVVPRLDQKSFWKDSSDFSEIFDVDWYISSLSKDVKIIKSLPKRGGKTWIPRSMRVPRKCSERCYQNRILPVLLKRHAIQLTKFDYRVANRLDTQLQKLRCRVNYHALKFTDSILQMGGKLAVTTVLVSAYRLLFEPDMLAFSGCYYGGGDKERKELGAIRKRWKTLHVSNPDKERRHGKCPLTPREVGLMLRALGYSNDVHIYVASGEVMAALDFIVCDESDVFVTNNNGNMARILAGRRRYFGHKPTIRPNAKKLYRLFLNQTTMSWEAFASKMRTYQRGFMGEPKGGPRKYGKGYDAVGDDVLGEDEPELSDPGDDGYQNGPQEKDQFNGTGMDYDGITNEEPELEEILSD